MTGNYSKTVKVYYWQKKKQVILIIELVIVKVVKEYKEKNNVDNQWNNWILMNLIRKRKQYNVGFQMFY